MDSAAYSCDEVNCKVDPYGHHRGHAKTATRGDLDSNCGAGVDTSPVLSRLGIDAGTCSATNDAYLVSLALFFTGSGASP